PLSGLTPQFRCKNPAVHILLLCKPVLLRLDFTYGTKIPSPAKRSIGSFVCCAYRSDADCRLGAERGRRARKAAEEIAGSAGQAAEGRRRSHPRTGFPVWRPESGAGRGECQARRSPDLGAMD